MRAPGRGAAAGRLQNGQVEESVEVCESLLSGGFGGEGAELGEVAGGFRDESGLVALAAMGHGGKVGAIGFEEEAIERDE